MTPLDIGAAQQIAESVVGAVDWRGVEGYCACPGIGRHSSRNAPTDCKVVVERTAAGVAPGVYCFHSSCSDEVEAASKRVRSLLGKQLPAPGPLPQRPIRKHKPAPVFSPEKLERFARRIPPVTPEFLLVISPKSVHNRTPASFLHEITQPGERILVFTEYRSQGQFLWQHQPPPFNACELDRFQRGAREGVWFLNNPVTGEDAPNDSGKPSRRSWKNVTNWRYLLIESDEADPDHWLAALAQLPLPITSLTTSGGKSIHALIRINADSKEEWDDIVGRMKSTLITLGGDKKAMSAVRLTRLPLCERVGATDNEGRWAAYDAPRMQQLLYLNPDPMNVPLYEMPAAPCAGSRLPAGQDGYDFGGAA